MKRALDVLSSLFALVLLSPLLLAAAVAIVLESGPPILFRQTRLGLGGREFRMYKFRTMVQDAAARGPYYTADADPRVTRVGAWLRRASIDELPQLLNVLKGEMSLIGPRPDVPEQRKLYSDQDWELRCSVRPGITGLAQALLRSEATAERRLGLDLRYAKEHSLLLDMRILVWTLARASGRGAN